MTTSSIYQRGLDAPVAGPNRRGAKRIAVIGAGACGICAAKYFLEVGFDVTVYEIGSQIGGLWCYQNDNGRSPAYRTLHINTSRGVTRFSDLDFDDATQLFTRQVADPLCGRPDGKPLGKGLNYKLHEFLGKHATKSNLATIMKGGVDGGTPALLFSGGHGMQFPKGDALQLAAQGALVCQDWEGYGEITPDHWFAAKDVPSNAKVHGMIHFMFACHGGGVPQFDDFDRLNNKPTEIAPRAFFSKLPQALLAHKNGSALAVLAHMERAWAYSFQGDGGFAHGRLEPGL